MELIPPLKLPNSDSTNIIGLLLAIIKFLRSSLAEHKTLIERLKKRNLELTVRLNKVNRVFAPKNEKSSEEEPEDSKKKKRGGQPGHEPTKRNIPKDLEKKRSNRILIKLPAAIAAKHPTSALPLLTKSQIKYS